MRKPLNFLYSELKVTIGLLKESLSKGFVYFLGFSLFLLVGTISFSFLDFFGQRIDQVKAIKLESENKILAGKLLDLEFFLSKLGTEINELGYMEQDIRSLFGPNPLKFNNFTDRNQIISESGGFYKENKVRNLDRFIDEIRDEKKGFEYIYEKLNQKKELLEHTPSIYPVDGYFSRGFGVVPDPFTGESGLHQGLDIVADIGTPIMAPGGK